MYASMINIITVFLIGLRKFIGKLYELQTNENTESIDFILPYQEKSATLLEKNHLLND